MLPEQEDRSAPLGKVMDEQVVGRVEKDPGSLAGHRVIAAWHLDVHSAGSVATSHNVDLGTVVDHAAGLGQVTVGS